MSTNPFETEELAAAIGRLAIRWASLELALDLSMYDIFHVRGGDSIEKELPRSLERKTRFLRAAVKKLPVLLQHQRRTSNLLDRVSKAAEFRHDVLHGVGFRYLVPNSPEIAMTRLLREPTLFKAKQFAVTVEQINQEADETAKLAEEAFELFVAVLSST